MTNEIIAALDESSGKYRVFLYSYEWTPSEWVRPILRLSSEPVFETAEAARQRLWNDLSPELRENTNPPEQPA